MTPTPIDFANPYISIIDRLRFRLGLNPTIHRRPGRRTSSSSQVARKKAQMKQLKEAPAPPIKTYGTGQEGADIYGAIPISAERVAEFQEEIKAEAEAEEEREKAAIKTYQKALLAQGLPRQQFNGLGPTDPAIKKTVEEWERKQAQLNRSTYTSPITNASRKSSPIKMGHTLRPLRPSS